MRPKNQHVKPATLIIQDRCQISNKWST